MNIQLVNQFFEKMSRDPGLQEEFVALAARHGIELLDDALSEDALAEVSGGTGMDQLRLQTYLERQQAFFSALSNVMKKASDTQSAIISNLKS
jgi:hypothetical protein